MSSCDRCGKPSWSSAGLCSGCRDQATVRHVDHGPSWGFILLLLVVEAFVIAWGFLKEVPA